MAVDGKKYMFKKGHGRHTLFGYLQIDKILNPSVDEIPKWLSKHPHILSEKRIKKASNRIFIARETCSFDENIKGYGIFKYNKELDLTKAGMTRTCWDLPDFFKNVKITYHTKDSWKDNYFKSACIGQEFVVEENKDVEEWAIKLIKNFSTNRISS